MMPDTIVCFYGSAASCQKFVLPAIDFGFATQRAPDKALWSLSPQSALIFDKTRAPRTVYNLPPVSVWAPSTAYGVGAAIVSPRPLAFGMLTYECLIAGTSSASGNGPTGTGTAVDGTVTWNYVGGAYGG